MEGNTTSTFKKAPVEALDTGFERWMTNEMI
uniref:Uncharacterized protein n=1 Tax=Parascaris equorum TaxID=6256 RepID=A0A914R7D8_PAREQ